MTYFIKHTDDSGVDWFLSDRGCWNDRYGDDVRHFDDLAFAEEEAIGRHARLNANRDEVKVRVRVITARANPTDDGKAG